MNIITHNLNGLPVGLRSSDGYIHLNPIANASGRRLADWKQNQVTIALLAQFTEAPEYRGMQPLVSVQGRNGGTWAHPDIAIAFAQWCNPAFALQVSRWVREWMETGKNPGPPKQSTIQLLWWVRLREFEFKSKIPVGYWCVFVEIGGLMRDLEAKGVVLPESAVVDISVGSCWCNYLRSRGYDTDSFRKYDHHYPDKRGCVPANIYPDEMWPLFKKWLHETYIPGKFPKYVRDFSTEEECLLIAAAIGHPILPIKRRLKELAGRYSA